MCGESLPTCSISPLPQSVSLIFYITKLYSALQQMNYKRKPVDLSEMGEKRTAVFKWDDMDSFKNNS